MKLIKKKAEFVGYVVLYCGSFPEWRCPDKDCGMSVMEEYKCCPYCGRRLKLIRAVLNLTDKKERKMSMNATKQGIEMRAKIKQAIISYMEKHGYAPTIREIGDMVGLSSTSSVHNHLIRMIATGELETDDEIGSPRAIRVPGYKIVKNE